MSDVGRMNRTTLNKEIEYRFSGHEIEIQNNNPFLIIKNNNEQVGNIEIYDDEVEYMVSVGDLTHCHFSC